MAWFDIPAAILGLLGALIASIYYALESLVLSLVPRKFLRKDVAGDVVLVTGGASGIGRLICLKMAARGAKIVSWDVNTAGNEETARLVVAAGGVCHTYSVDLSDRHAIYAAADSVKQEVGKVDILINNAGIVTGKNFKDAPDNLIEKTFQVNIMSHFWTTKAFLGDMLASNKGHIVTVASLAGLAGVNRLADYCASKFAAVGFDESLRIELKVEGYDGVKTTAVCPYYINTGMFAGVTSKLVPILQPDFVASETVDGILLNSPMVILPSFCRLLIILKYILPVKGSYQMYTACGGHLTMENFKGHPEDSLQQKQSGAKEKEMMASHILA